MAVKVDGVINPLKILQNSQEANKGSSSLNFDELLAGSEETSGLKPSSAAAKEQMEIIKSLARMEMESLNNVLFSAFGSSPSSPSGGLTSGGGMLGLMQILQLLQAREAERANSQNTVADVENGAEKGAGPKDGDAAENAGLPDVEYDLDQPIPDAVAPARDYGIAVSSEKERLIDGSYEDGSSKSKTSRKVIDQIVEKTASVVGLDANLIRAVIKTESNFNSGAVSRAGAMGLMQLMPETARDLGVTEPFDPESNVMGGATYLKMMLDRYSGDINKALAAYNWGPGNLERNRNSGFMPEETRNYLSIVKRYYKEFQNESQEV